MGAFESIVERQIEAGRNAGLFDDLALHGKPIPDIDTQRPAGWFAARIARRERSKLKAEELDRSVRISRANLWRAESETEVRTGVATINRAIDEYNRVTTWVRREPLDPAEVVARWQTYRSQP